MRNWSMTGVALLAVSLSLGVDAGTRTTVEGSGDLTPIFEAAQSWTTEGAGLWHRPSADGKGIETYATGIEGLEQALVQLKDRLSLLVDAYLAKPTDKRRELLDNHMALVREVEADLAAKRAAVEADLLGGFEAAPQALAACQRTFSYGTSINRRYCLENTPANASYSTDNPTACPEQCTVHTYSYAVTECLGHINEEYSHSCSQTGTNVSCYSNVIVQSEGDFCYLYSFASIHCPQLGGLYLYESDYKNTCLCGNPC
jgi:hypothetical protein